MAESYSQNFFRQIHQVVDERFLFGQRKTLHFMLVAYLCGGHILLEGPPGTGKTVAARLLARLLAKDFSRIQFTSDLLPADILGASLYNPGSQSFRFIPGPIFADFVLADELNRTPPRTQSALLEAMEERQVTVEGERHLLSENFFVIATQNPREYEGTFPLPEAQLDRFLFCLRLENLSQSHETQMIRALVEGSLPPPLEDISRVEFDKQIALREIDSVQLDDSIASYIASLLAATRSHPKLEWGASFRGGISLARCSRILALLDGRDFVIPDDVQQLVIPALRHRIKRTPESLVSEIAEEAILEEIIQDTPFPT